MSDFFGAVDYLVLVAMLVISTCIGLFFAWKDRKNTDEDEFLRGGKHMSTIPVCISIMASFLPSTSFIGFPTVVYVQGTQFWIVVIPGIIAAIVACEIFIPIYYNMNLTSVNEYLLKRFKSKTLQVVANISVLLAYVPFFGVEMFAPAIALSIVTDMSINSSIFVIGVIVTLYTSLGGLKGVIWTDFFQFAIMMIGMVGVIVRGADISGGMASSFQRAHAGGRIEFWNMNFDFYEMNSFWMLFMGSVMLWTGTMSTSQIQVQRSVCMPTLKSAKRALYCAIPGFIFVITLVSLAGIVMYARFYDCDPLLTGRVKRADQLLPYFVLDIFEDNYKGLPGAFVACIFGSSLSTLSSGLNAMATIIWDDYGKRVFRRLPDKYSVFATRAMAALIGAISIGLALIFKHSENIVEVAVSIYSASLGPIFAVFCMGLFIPWSNAIGCGTALIVGQAMCLCVTIGWVADKRDPKTMMLGLSTDGCDAHNITVTTNGTSLAELLNYKIPEYHPQGIQVLTHINPFFMSVIGYLISMVIGNVVSLATMGNKNTEIDVDLVHHKVCYYMEKLLPKSWRQLQDKKPRQKITNAADRQLVANNNNVDIGPDIVDIKKDLTGAYFVGEGLSEDKRASVRLKSIRLSDTTNNL